MGNSEWGGEGVKVEVGDQAVSRAEAMRVGVVDAAAIREGGNAVHAPVDAELTCAANFKIMHRKIETASQLLHGLDCFQSFLRLRGH